MRLRPLKHSVFSVFTAGLGAFLVLSLATTPVRGAEALPKLGTALSKTSVSGLSSGAYMAGQFQIAHAENIVGAGLVAGGPFACAETAASRAFPFWPTAVIQNATQAVQGCMKTHLGVPDPERLVERAGELAEDGEIAPLSALVGHNVYLYSGKEDETVQRPVVKAAARFYALAGVDPGNLTLVLGDGGHAFITEDGGAACGLSEEPYVSDCDYDQARAILGWIYGPLKPASTEPQGTFVAFDQQAFADPGDGFADEGIVYVPPSCRARPSCRVHVALHGCQQSRARIGDTFIREVGFAELADTNRLVVLFPQVKASAYNPQGCWDWWGYTGLDYLGKEAAQISALWKMVETLSMSPSEQK